MNQFSKTISIGKEERLFLFARIVNTNGVKFFITSKDVNQKPFACSLKQEQYGQNWKLVPGSLKWLYEIEDQLSDAIVETQLN